MALSADTPRKYEANTLTGNEKAYPVQGSSTVYAGSAVSIDSNGEVGPLSASDAGFVGFARKQADNSAGSAGDTNVAVYTKGVIELTVTGLDDNDDLGDIVYATDDGTFTLTASGAVGIGKVAQIVSLSDNKCRVAFTSLHNEHFND